MPSFIWSQQHDAFIKECISCGEIFVGTDKQEESEKIFRRNFGVGGQSNSDGLHTSCNLCKTQRANGYRITHMQRRELYKKQNGTCPLCNRTLTYEQATIDHCHGTGIIRGLLHTQCNSQLGFYESHKERIEKYLGIK